MISCLFLTVYAFSGESQVRAGRSGISAHLFVGKNTEDSIAQAGVDYEYGIMKHLSAGGGYVYVDGRHPLQAHGANFYVKGYVFDTVFDVYGKIAAQLYYQNKFGIVTTYFAGVEWQSPFKLYINIEGGAELEEYDWGYLAGVVIGLRL